MTTTYWKRVLLALMLYTIIGFFGYIILHNLEYWKYFFIIPTLYLIFRYFIQMVTIKIISDILFLYCEKEIKIHQESVHIKQGFSIIKTFKHNFKYKPFYYSNKVIDYCFKHIIKWSGVETQGEYQFSEIFTIDAKIWLKTELTKEEAEIELKKMIRLKKMKNIISED